MATATLNYTGPTAITCGVASLESSATFVAGRESDQINNTSNKFIDALLQGFATTGTSPTAGKTINIYVWGSHTSLASAARDTLDGADSAETITSENVRNGFLKRAASITIDSTSTRTYEFGPVSVAALFGGVMPQYWGLFFAHDTGVALDSGTFQYTGIKYDVA